MNPLPALVVEAWADFDRVIAGVSADEAVENPEGQSSIAWTLGHVTEHLDRMINHALMGRDRDPVLGPDRFRMGSEGVADDWDAIRAAVNNVRATAGTALSDWVDDEYLEHRYEPPGAITQELGGVTVRYVLLRIVAHHYFHIGVIACQRDLRGDSVGDYPGLLRGLNG